MAYDLNDYSAQSAFANHARQIIEAGYSPIPIVQGHKRPDLKGWQQAAKEQMPEGMLADFVRQDRHGLGVACGYGGLIAVDIDTEEAAIMAAVRGVLQESSIAKVGRKGRTDFYRAAGEIKNKKFKGGKAPIVEILAAGSQTVIPPTPHPAGMQYKWVSPHALWDLRPDELPEITPDHIQRLQAALTPWTGKPDRQTAYGLATIEERCKELADVPEGGRNNALYEAVCRVGRWVHHGKVSRDDLTARLMSACHANGLVAQKGEDSCLATIESGLDASSGDPLPELPDDGKRSKAVRRKNEGGAQDGEIVGPVTQDAIATAFVRHAAGRLKFCHSRGAWIYWTDRYWRRDATMTGFHYARKISREQSSNLDEDEKKSIRRATFAGGVERFARSDPAVAVTAEFWDANPWLLGTPNGTVDLRTGDLRPPDAADGISKVTAVPPSATADCPTWLAFLNDATKSDHAFTRFLQQICGYVLTGVVREHVIFFLYGLGGNGKSTFLRVLTDILADYGVIAPMTTFTAAPYDQHPTDLAGFAGARLISASETEQNRQWAKVRLQQMTGGEPITARFMRQDFFTYLPQFKPLIVGNHAPRLQTVDDAFKRRFHMLPFNNKPAAPDRTLGEKLRVEYPAILRWMIEGCNDWRENGLTVPKAVTNETERYLTEQANTSEAFESWRGENCTVEPGNNRLSARGADLFGSWETYCKLNHEDTGSRKRFGMRLAEIGLQSVKDRLGTTWHGIELKEGAL